MSGASSNSEPLVRLSALILIRRISTVGRCFHDSDELTIHSHYKLGNEAPQASVDALYRPNGNAPTKDDPNVSCERASKAVLYTYFFCQWNEILPKVDLGPSSRHLFHIQVTDSMKYVKLNMYPDGGIVRASIWNGFPN